MTRGHNATSPWHISSGGWMQVFKRTFRQIGEDHVGLVAAGCAFYGLLALFPAIAAVMGLAGLFTDPATVVDQLSALTAMLPQGAASIVTDQAQAVASAGGTGLGFAVIAGLVTAIFSASKGVQALMEGLNVAYDEDEERGFIRLLLVRLALTLTLILGFVVGIALAVAVPMMVAMLSLGPVVETAAQWLRWPLLLLVAGAGMAILYRWGPSRQPARWRWITPGVAAACVLWIIGTVAFAIYVRNFGNYNETFGAISGVIVLLLWMWLSAYIVLMGAELDAELERQTRRDTTTGAPRPKGERGAVVADEAAPQPGRS